MATELTPAQVSSWRLRQQFVAPRASRGGLRKVVSKVCGLQAQVLSAAELALRARVEGLRQQDVRDALWEDHSILRTWCMRGTLHLLSTSDLPLYVSALSTKLEGLVNWLRDNEGIADSEISMITSSIGRTLGKNRALTREQLSQAIERNPRLSTKARKELRSAWGTLLRPSAYRGDLAFGPIIGPNVTFVNPRPWIKAWKDVEPGGAFREIIRRFFETYGPTEIREFSHWWGGLTDTERSALRTCLEDMEQVRVMNEEWGFMTKSDAKEAERMEAPRIVRLLPSFDCYGVFYSPRDAFVSRHYRTRIFSQEAGWIFPALVIDGIASGVWGMKKSRGRISVEIKPFRRLTETEKDDVREESEDIGRFLDANAETTFELTSVR